VSEQPETYSAQEAEAEGVRPLREEELAEMQRWVSGLTFVQGGLADRIERLLATLDAARAELERKEAEAAVLREALLFVQPYMEGAHFNRVDAREIIWAQARKALNTTQAGVALLERVRKLEGELEELRGLAPIAQAAVEYVDEDDDHLVPGAWYDLKHAVQVYRADHQGTGAAREGE
jgi:hypothetical protein